MWVGFLAAMALLGCLGGALVAGDPATPEPQLKAALLWSFAKFVEWPQAAFANDQSPMVIGVFGTSPVGGELATLAAGKRINNRTVEIRTIHNGTEAVGTHLVFIGTGQERAAKDLLHDVGERAVLTVGDSNTFLSAGGIIGIARESDKLRFDINLRNSEKAGLRISSQLQKLARSVTRANP